ncbi:G-patch domain and KOW motifs-containing protein [Alligator sinensis]|uniref:G-patch domain and KOW motifs-containing protein n=1 Tax=Alligator sinensis TaxID=38654 RepID=A0A1U7SHP8_ALLSI|nr:G-patch domain and KOW motifs-containing protein [Alligator sinensis]
MIPCTANPRRGNDGRFRASSEDETTTPMMSCGGDCGCGKMAAPAAGGAGPVSFGFTRTAAGRRRLPGPGSGPCAEPDATEHVPEPDFVRAMEDRELQSVCLAPRPPSALVIPLIRANQWKRPAGEASPDPVGRDRVEGQAIREIIEESQRALEVWEAGAEASLARTIPMLVQNRVLSGYEDSDHVDVSLRPESATEADYEEVPVEAYGLAMLRGMGWKEGEGIGHTFKQAVKPLEHELRPKGLGLGAAQAPLPFSPLGIEPPEEGNGEEPLGLAARGSVLIQAGPHQGLYGKIEGLDPDNARAMVKLALGGQTVTLSQHSLQSVTWKEYKRLGKDLSCLSKAHKEEEEQQRNGLTTHPNAGLPQHRKEEPGQKRKQGVELQRLAKQARSDGTPCWLRRDLRVRCIDHAYKGGKYYNTKMVVEDVLGGGACVCRTDDGRVLEGLRAATLETVIPRGVSDRIMVVLGNQAGRVGYILQRDGAHGQALVQLPDVGVVTLDYNTICHYVGHHDDDDERALPPAGPSPLTQ